MAVRVRVAGKRRAIRLALWGLTSGSVALLMSGWALWLWSEMARLVTFHEPMGLPRADAAKAMWRLVMHGGWSHPYTAFPRGVERAQAPGELAYLLVAVLVVSLVARLGWGVHGVLRGWRAGSPLGKGQRTLARRAVERGWVRTRTWGLPSDTRRLWVPGPVSGRPYLGLVGRAPRRMLAAEVEMQPMIVAPPRIGKSSGMVVPWLLDHDGPALVLSTKRDVYSATVTQRERAGRVWVYDPFGDQQTAGFTPLVPARTWTGAIRAGDALASAAHPDQANAANEFWDKEAASMLAPLLHAAAISNAGMGELVKWLDTRRFDEPHTILEQAGAGAAANQLQGVRGRDERNRETTVMSALNLLRAYRYPEVVDGASGDLTPEAFLDGRANTIYVVSAGHEQEVLRPVILALVSAVYETAMVMAGRYGPLDPRLFMLLDEAANIAPVQNLGSWLSQCGDAGVMIATIWQSIAQIDQRYGRAGRDAICAASTAQLFMPPLTDPTTSGYLSELLGEEAVAHASDSASLGRQSRSIAREKAGPTPWLRQISAGRAILIYRELPPTIVQVPGWFEDPRFSHITARPPRGHLAHPPQLAS